MDKTSKMSDNSNNSYALPEYETEGQSYRTTKAEMQPLNDPRCTHDWIPDDSEEPNDLTYAVKCSKCILGTWLPRTS